jgi:hypothetical protein
MEFYQQETLDAVVLVLIEQNGITFVVENYSEIREDYYIRKEGATDNS